MKLYEIDAAILSLIDAETGEVADYEAFDALVMERERKLENVALYIKELTYEADAIKAEREALYDREKRNRNRVERLKAFLITALDGERFSTPKVAVSFRRSSALEYTDEFFCACKESGRFLRIKEPELDRAAVRDALKAGEELSGACLRETHSIQIK